MNPRLRRDWCLKPAPWTARPSNLAACGCARTLFAKCCKTTKCNSPTGIRTRVVWVKTTYPDQLDYWGFCAGRESNPGLVRGRDVYYHCTTGACVFVLGFEPRISRVLGERHNQARPYEHWKPPTRIELVTLRLLSACSAN